MLNSRRIAVLSSLALVVTVAGCASVPAGSALFALADSADAATPTDVDYNAAAEALDVTLPHKGYGILGHYTKSACFGDPVAVFTNARCDKAAATCPTDEDIIITGSRNEIQGDTHSNTNERIAGNQNSCSGHTDVVGATRNQGHQNNLGQIRKVSATDFPTHYSENDYKATYSFTGDVDLGSMPGVWSKPGTLRPGIYRTTGSFTLSGNNVHGVVTLIAKSVIISGKGHQLFPHTDGLLCLATDGDVHVAGNSNLLSGLCQAAKGVFRLTGHRNALYGMVMSNTAHIAGSQNRIIFEDFGFCHEHPTPSPSPTTTPAPTVVPVPVLSPSASPPPSPTPVPPQPTTTPTPSGSPIYSPTPTATTSALPVPPPGSGATWGIGLGAGPYALALNAAQNLMVTNPAGQSMSATQVDSANGSIIRTVTSGFTTLGVAVEPSTQRVWFTNKGNNDVIVFNADGTQAFRTPQMLGALGTPDGTEGIAFDAAGSPWVTDYTNGTLLKLDLVDGHILQTTKMGTHPRSIKFDPSNGHMWIADNGANAILEVDATGKTILQSVAVGGNPSRVAIDGQGNLWATNTGPDIPYTAGAPYGTTVTKFSRTGVTLGTFTVGNSPFGVAIDHSGNVLVVNTGSNSVTKLALDGTILNTYLVPSQPYDVVIDNAGYAYISSFAKPAITKLVP